MKTNYKKLIEGIGGYIKFALNDGKGSEEILMNITHDIFGVINNVKCFLPRTLKYKKYL